MQSSNNNLLVEELARVSTLTPHTSKILKKLLKDTPHSPLLEQTLVSLTCQTKNLCHYKTSNPSSHQDEAISLIVELLSKLSKYLMHKTETARDQPSTSPLCSSHICFPILPVLYVAGLSGTS